ncbi:hypothetical protein CVD25_21465 [Bacillus canaveralius]|uniref:HNH endonuclease n=1 Tax=Bacillus canaveralius TaxID=1403243 RepID=A0A2N5GPC3_9BACI|nr:NUMOD4 domain-containing protein [Bacillus canaveralius]PLR84299.1 hypothetical protein CU635_08265 [Bacillus canaveralius]PLR89474.1 hypothetical protein CVD25_21465 [Bacillus canaveralius]
MEIWKDIEGYNGKYQVSNHGRVKSTDYYYTGKEKVLKITPYNGYRKVGLAKDKNDTMTLFNVHRLVATAFIPKVEGKPLINHIDGNRANNHVSNL